MTNNFGLAGAYPLVRESIQATVAAKRSGAYALGYLYNGVFQVERIGRSDVDLARRLTDYIGQYDSFMFVYETSPHTAFLKECSLFHAFETKNNPYHPDRPDDANWLCPHCGIFGVGRGLGAFDFGGRPSALRGLFGLNDRP